MSKRQQIIDQIRYAGYHGDKKKFMRLYVDNRITLTTASKAYYEGERLKESGMFCNCPECSE